MNKTVLKTIVIGTIAILGFIMLAGIFETNSEGQFQIRQALWTGNMSARFKPGTYFNWFGTVNEYKNVATVGFGESHIGEGSADIDAIPVIFNDGSIAQISGLIRIKLPNQNPNDALRLKNEFSGGYEHFIRSGVVPIVTNAIKLSANLRSAQDAYTTLALFQQAVNDQLRNGIYVTKSDVITIERSTGDIEKQKVTVIVTDSFGNPKRMVNHLQTLGCEVLECVIDVPVFDSLVTGMIAKRKDEAMKTELAKQSALRAKQDAITAEEQGKANVAKAKYEEEVIKAKAVTVAEREFEVAELNAMKSLEEKKRVIAEGQATAEANRLKVAAGLTPQEKAEWDYKTKVGVAEQLAKANTPGIVISNGGNSGTSPLDYVGLKFLMDINEKLSK